jgi:D-alanyl-D-alanine carboxypeptidase
LGVRIRTHQWARMGRLGPALESLARKGETMTVAQMATYAYVQIDQARAELNAISKWTNYDRLKRRSQLMTRIAFPSRGHGRFKTVNPNRTPVQLPAVRVFTDRGWRWGGYWRTPIDYQHLSDDHRHTTLETELCPCRTAPFERHRRRTLTSTSRAHGRSQQMTST